MCQVRVRSGQRPLFTSPLNKSENFQKFQQADGKGGLTLTRNTKRRCFLLNLPSLQPPLFSLQSHLARRISSVVRSSCYLSSRCYLAPADDTLLLVYSTISSLSIQCVFNTDSFTMEFVEAPFRRIVAGKTIGRAQRR